MQTDNKILAILEEAGNKAWTDYRTICCLSGGEMRMVAKGLPVHYGDIRKAFDLAIELDSIIEWHKGSVLTYATFTDDNGNNWHLEQDGDLFAVCYELLTGEEKDFLGIED